ncbi:MAG: CBO0543 family protein [Bacillota bacterium]
MVIRFVHTLFVTPFLTLIFLSNLPKEVCNQFFYLIRWVLIASLVEYLAHKKKLILYAHGWNVFWSSILYLMMFICSYLFTKYPINTLVLSLYSTLFYVYKFQVPLRRKHYSKYYEALVDLRYHTWLEDLLSSMKRKVL